jgi:hypothetical protein
MRIGQIFRYARPYNPNLEAVDGLPNYFYHTYTEGQRLPLLDSGINPIQKLKAADGVRCPAILISSSPHKIGSVETPWQDFFDPDNGRIRYFGDNKRPGLDPTLPDGNKALLEQFETHTSPDERERILACPIIYFKRVAVMGRTKGNVEFQGFGIISRAERITQFDRKNQRPFTNYVFDFVVFSLCEENEEFDWKWIAARRNPTLSREATLQFAPVCWRIWVKEGSKSVEKCRRRIAKLLTYSTLEQRPKKGSPEAKVLEEIYAFYSGRKSRFEALASLVAARIIKGDGNAYRHGWITPPSSDGGADFIGRLDIGSDLARTKLVVLGQAKCEKMASPTGGNHIARTVARLKRGWIGIYVTTSYFSESVQREVLEDKYPIILINGLRLAKEVFAIIHEQGFGGIKAFLEEVDRNCDKQLMERDPEEILYE